MSSHNRNHHVVVLGGGITGLSAAFYLARKHPTVQITLVEKCTRFGGWVRSERVEVCDSHGNRGRVLLEAGPRTIRPNAKSVLELIHLLDLRSEVICTPRASPAGRNRFLHVPPTQGLQPLPSGLFSLFSLPLGRLVLRAVLAEPFVPPNHPQKNPPALSPSPSAPPPPPAPHETTETDPSGAAAAAVVDGEDDDESVDSFFSRRFGDAFARTLGSALVHGIYAADSRVLSLRAAFPQLRASEARGNGSVIWGELGPAAWFGSKKTGVDDKSQEQVVEEGGDHEWEAQLGRTAALFSFREGMETLVRGLVEALRGFPNVALRSGVAVRGIGIDAAADDDDDDDDDRCSFQIYLDTEGEDADEPLRATHVISALPLPVLDSVLQPPPAGEAAAGGASTTHPSLPHLRANPHSSVTVLNLVFPTTTSTPNGSTGEAATSTSLHPPGFGYLIPRPEHGYSEPGREDEEELGPGLLGVVFDTASLPEQDHDAANDAASVGFTKLTAMLGGPYPSPHPRDPSSSSSESESESDAQLVAAVLPHISSQLGHALPPPVHYAVHRNVESIPTYLVGHTARMEELRRVLSERWGGRLKVVGAGVGGVSVADCVKAGRQAAFEVGAQINSRT